MSRIPRYSISILQITSINRVSVLNISIDRSRYTDYNDWSPLPRHCRKDHTVDADNFVILSLTGERGRPYHHLVYQFLRDSKVAMSQRRSIYMHSPRGSNEVLSFMLISLTCIYDNGKPRGCRPRINGRPWIARLVLHLPRVILITSRAHVICGDARH